MYSVFGGEIRVSSYSMMEPASVGQSIIYTPTPHPLGTACTECVKCKQASVLTKSPSLSLLMANYLPTVTVSSYFLGGPF